MSTHILIVDDEADIRNLIRGILEDEGYTTGACATSTEAYAAFAEKPPSLVILDIWLQGSTDDGLTILKNLTRDYPNVPVLMISGHGTIETAVAAIKDGAYDFIEKPFKSDRLLLMIRRALETAALKQENESLRRQAGTSEAPELVGASPPIEKLRQAIARTAPTNSRVLLTGEPGTGKNVVARILHESSERATAPYMVVNCASLHSERLETELFGSAESEKQKTGLLEQANGGTLLLDEIVDMSMKTQAKIVRVLQEQRFQKAGSNEFTEVDVRILATTNKDIQKAIQNGQLREDLYYRLNVIPLHIPALRERTVDIEALARSFLRTLGPSFGVENADFDEPALKKLRSCPWPGNARQLRNVVEWVLIMHAQQAGTPPHFGIESLPPEISGKTRPDTEAGESKNKALSFEEHFMESPLREAREIFEREYLLSQIRRFEGNISKTAQFVGMERSALHRKLRSLRIQGNEEDTKENSASIRKRA